MDFIGIVEKKESYHKKVSNATITVTDNYTYDHVNRLTKHTQTIGGHTELIAQNIYDELGNMTQKLVGNTGSNFLQTIDYEYNVRGWLEMINDIDNISNDLFTFELSYNNTELSGSVSLYNGDISEAIWLTANDKLANSNNTSRAYNYNYDGLNRLVDADYFKNEAKPYITEYDLKTVYDKNGNLTTLRRGRSYGTIDDLIYNYNHNRLIEVVDSGHSVSKAEGFVDDGIAGNDYSYDDNGNLTSDANKGITSVMYNHLNMPTEIKFNGSNSQKINYIYNANGIKQRKITNDNGNITTTDYAGNFVYENGSLKLFFQPEGYVMPDGNGGFDYVFQYKDIWRNVRLSYSDTNKDGNIDPNTDILDEKNYYPFGMQHKGYNNSVTGAENNYKTYQSKELERALGLNWHDFGARRYDAAIARWISVDPLAEEFSSWSPYTAMNDNPIRFVDPNGRAPFDIIITGNASTIEKYKNTVSAATGGFYTVNIDNSGKVSLSATGIGNLGFEMTAEQKTFYNDYSTVVNSTDVVRQEVVENDAGTTVDSWVTGKIDMADVGEFDKAGNGAASSAGALIHSTVEQHEKIKLGLSSGDIGATSTNANGNTVYTDYSNSHKTAISAENRTNGNYRGVGGNENMFLEKDGTKTLQTITPNSSGGINITKIKIK